MKKKSLIIIIIITIAFSQNLFSQIYWASRVDSISTKYSKDRYGARELLGVPNVDPQGRNSVFSWGVKPNSLNKENKETAFIDVAFVTPQYANQLAIFESWNPGAIAQILVKREASIKEWTSVYVDSNVIARTGVYTFEGQTNKNDLTDIAGTYKYDKNIFKRDSVFIAHKYHNITNVFFEPQKVQQVRIVLNLFAVDGWNQIDAVGITNSKDSIKYPEPLLADQTLIIDKASSNMGHSVNTNSNDLYPIISPDEKRLYFSKLEYDKKNYVYTQNIWYSDLESKKIYSCNPERSHNYKENDIWQNSDPIFWEFNTLIPNTIVGFSADGSKMYLSNLYQGIEPNKEDVFKKETSGLSVTDLDSAFWNKADSTSLTKHLDTNKIKKYSHFFIDSTKNILLTTRYDSLINKSKIHVWLFNEKKEKWTNKYFLGFYEDAPFSFSSEIDKEIVRFWVDVDSIDVNNIKVASLTWQQPKTVKITNFENKSNYTSYFIAPDGETMFLAIDDGKTYGDTLGTRDIYTSKYNEDTDTWSQPENIGEPINTLGDESSPFFDGDGLLYFASSGHHGYGEYDIYVTSYDENQKKWKQPKNLGTRINTPGSEVNFRISEKSRMAYYSSSDWSEGCSDNTDIFSIQMGKAITIIIKGQTLNSNDNYNPIPEAKVSLTAMLDDNTKGVRSIEFVSSEINGNYNIKITKLVDANKMTKFGFFARKDGKYFQTDSLHPKNEIFCEYINLTNPGWTVTINQNLFLNGPEAEDIYTPDPPDPPCDTCKTIIYRDRIVYDTIRVYGDILVDTIGCPTFFHDHNFYTISKSEGGTSKFQIATDSYEEFFTYNETSIQVNEQKFKTLKAHVLQMLGRTDDIVNVYIVASASKVPTTMYCSNFELARMRAEEPQKRLKQILSTEQYNRLSFEKRYIVEGKEYENDPENKKEYEKYQYVKIWLYSCPVD